MTNRKNTSRALVASALAVLLCVSMLVGSTFAWFTDNATTNVNTIQAGTLQIDIQDANGNSLRDQTLGFVDDKGNILNTILWEPGCRYLLQPAKVVNLGNLWVKYKVIISGYTAPTEGADLAKVIDVYEGETLIGTLDEVLTGGVLVKESVLAPKDEENASAQFGTLKLVMKETAGNEYQGATISGVAITVQATQYTKETDSYNDQYDANATYSAYDIKSFEEAVNNAAAGDTVQLGSTEIALAENLKAGVSIAGDGAAKTAVTVPANTVGNRVTGLQIMDEGTTISGVTLKQEATLTSDQYAGVASVKAGNTTFNNVVINATDNTSAIVIESFQTGVVTISNSTLTSEFKTIHIADHANGTVLIENSDITGVYTFNVNSESSKDLVVEVNNSKLHGWTSYGNIAAANFNGVEFSKGNSSQDYLRAYAPTTLSNCTFDAAFKLNAVNSTTVTITNCTWNGTKLTAENIKGMLDADDNLKACTITVDGVAVTF